MTSGPVMLLCLERANAIKAWRGLMGPTNSEKARQEAPYSLRAKFGVDGQKNATHGSDSFASANRELGLFFPHQTERTFAMIKPDAVGSGHVAKIIEEIEAHGFTIAAKKETTLTIEQTKHFYIEHKDRPFYHDLTHFMSSGPVVLIGLERSRAIKAWRTLMGPTNSLKAREQQPHSLRAKFGVDGQKNATHGSDSPASAVRELSIFFPELIERTFAIIKPDSFAHHYEQLILRQISDHSFHIEEAKQLIITQEQVAIFYEEHKGREFYLSLTEWMSSAEVMVLCLARPRAVKAWRALIGPTDPAKAKVDQPSTIRALFGTSPQQNAVHGSDSAASAHRELGIFFPRK